MEVDAESEDGIAMSMDGIEVRDRNAVSTDRIDVNGKKRMPYEREGKKQGFFNESDDMQTERERL